MLITKFRTFALPAMLAALFAGSVDAAPVTLTNASLIDATTDLDGNGIAETEYSRIAQQFVGTTNTTNSASLTARVTFNYMFMTSESSATSGQHDSASAGFDVFIIRVRRSTGNVLASIKGVVYNDGRVYTGSFTQYDFENDQVGAANQSGPDDPYTFASGAPGFSVTSHVEDGGIGWLSGSLTFGRSVSTNNQLIFEAIIADGGDRKVDSVLLLDNLALVNNLSATTAFSNAGFEAALAAPWTVEGEVGRYQGFSSDNNLSSIAAPAGSWFVALTTADTNWVPPINNEPEPTIPEPTALAAMSLGLALLVRRGRR